MQCSILMPMLIFVCCSSTPNSHIIETEGEIDFSVVKREVQWFIEKVKPESINQGKNNVYVVRLYEEQGDQYCFTIGYIDCSIFVKYVEGFKHYFQLNDDLILLDYSDDFKAKYKFLNADSVQPLTNKQIIWDKIDKEFESMGTSGGYVCCYKEGNINKVYYEDSDEIPDDKAIFIYIPKGTLIELDSGSMKKIIKGKKEN